MQQCVVVCNRTRGAYQSCRGGLQLHAHLDDICGGMQEHASSDIDTNTLQSVTIPIGLVQSVARPTPAPLVSNSCAREPILLLAMHLYRVDLGLLHIIEGLRQYAGFIRSDESTKCSACILCLSLVNTHTLHVSYAVDVVHTCAKTAVMMMMINSSKWFSKAPLFFSQTHKPYMSSHINQTPCTTHNLILK